MKLCSHEECTKRAVRGGVCWAHGANPAQKAKAVFTSVSLPHQAVDYEVEEELNSWIWGSIRTPRKLG